LFLCRTGADSRPQISLPNISEKILPSTKRTLYRTGPTSQTPYQILVLTDNFLGFLVGVTYEILVPLWLLTLPPNLF
jgi:hypothetical protein